MRIALLLSLALWGCSPSAPAPSTNPTASTPTGHHHEHAAPHGGKLVEIGEELAHLEVVWKAETGDLRIYVLDGEARNGVPLTQVAMKLKVDQQNYELAAQSNSLSGEKPGNSSEFAGKLESLKNQSTWKGVVERVELKGQKFDGLQLEISP